MSPPPRVFPVAGRVVRMHLAMLGPSSACKKQFLEPRGSKGEGTPCDWESDRFGAVASHTLKLDGSGS